MAFVKSEKLWVRVTNGQISYAAVGGLCVLIWAIIAGWPGAMTAVSYDQERLDTAISAPSPENPIEFSFVPDHDGLSSIEVVVVNFRPDEPNGSGPATLSLFDENGVLLISRSIAPSTPHNTNIRLDFSPIKNSRSQTLKLTLIGESGGQISLWGYSLNVWPESQLSGAGEAQTLRAVTRYAFQWSTLPGVLAGLLGRFWSPILVALLYLPLPGALFFAFWHPNRRAKTDPIVRLALVFGGGIVTWPLVWQWLTLIGLHFSSPILWGIVVLGWILVAIQHFRRTDRLLLDSEFWLFAAFLIFTFSLRLIAIRDMAFLPWVDSSRHALITAIMRDSGQFLITYEPYLPVSWSGYHYGLHTLSAGIAIMVGDTVSLPDQLLPLMQLLSALTTLTVFAGAVLLTGRRSVGWIAAFLLSLPFLFPAYYTTWGRLTQMSGMIVLPLIIGLMAQGYSSKSEDHSQSRFQYVVLTTGLIAGLFLLHARVFFYFVPFGIIIGCYHLYGWIRSKRMLEELLFGPIGQLVTIALSAAVLVAPRIWRLLSETTYVGTGLGVVSSPEQPLLNFPIGYAQAGWESWFWLLAGGAIVVAMICIFVQPKQQNSERPKPEAKLIYAIILLAGWLALLYLMTAGPALHPRWPILLPQSSVNSAYIAAFAAQAILISTGIILTYQFVNQFNRLAGLILIAIIGAGLTAGTLFGVHNQVVILNRSTVLGQQADLAAIAWIKENTPPNAKVANNSWLWLNGTWAGTDGAAWLTPMTGRITGTPPIDHIYNSRVFGLTSAFNDTAKDVADWSDPNTLDLLRQNRFTHIFTGVSDGSGAVDYDPAELLRNPGVKPVFSADGVYVFEILPP